MRPFPRHQGRSSEPPLGGETRLVLGTQLRDPVLVRHLRRGYVPPDAGRRQVGVWDGGNHNHHRPVVVTSLGERVAYFRGGGRPHCPCPKAASHLDQIHL